jgi:hypothetical protein
MNTIRQTIATITAAVLMLISLPAGAQIAVPSLDRTQPSEMPGAASWRFSATIGAAAAPAGSGAYRDTDGTKTDNLERTWLEGYIFHLFEEITIEYHNLVEFREVRENLASDSEYTKKTQQDRLNLAMRLMETISVGITQRTWKNNGDIANSTGQRHETGGGQEVGIGAGLSVRLANFFHLAFGLEDVTHRQSGWADNRWVDRYLGVALMGEGDFRIEYNKIMSPESIKTDAIDRPASDDTRLAIDVKFGDFVLGYETRDITVKPIHSGDDILYEYTSLGLSLVPQDGLLLSFRVTNGKQGDWYETTDARFAIGFNY